MKEVNRYYEGYQDSSNKIEYLKFGLLNEFGHSERGNSNYYDEEKIIKTRYNHRG